MTEDGRSSRDTDWFLDKLYDLPELAHASQIVANYSRYVVDLNRPSDNVSLYPGQTTTGLIPQTCFDGSAIYRDDRPDENETDERVQLVWRPYHKKLQEELKRLRDQHGVAVLIEAHSIKSEVPLLFDGVLPDFNVGTNKGQSCAGSLCDVIENVLSQQQKDQHSGYSYIINGRFIGGFITREYGNPENQIHAVQFELSQATYMNEEDLTWADEKAIAVQPVFQRIAHAVVQWIMEQEEFKHQ